MCVGVMDCVRVLVQQLAPSNTEGRIASQVNSVAYASMGVGYATVILDPNRSDPTPVTVPAAFVLVGANTDREPFVENSMLVFVVVNVRFVSVLTKISTVPTVVGMMYWLQEYE